MNAPPLTPTDEQVITDQAVSLITEHGETILNVLARKAQELDAAADACRARPDGDEDAWEHADLAHYHRAAGEALDRAHRAAGEALDRARRADEDADRQRRAFLWVDSYAEMTETTFKARFEPADSPTLQSLTTLVTMIYEGAPAPA